LLVALVVIATLSAATGAFIMAVTSRTKTAYESASWRQAALAAESSANLAMVEIRRVLPDLNGSVAGAWRGWTSSSGTLPTGRTIPAGVTLIMEPPALTCAGEGNTVMTAHVTLDAPVEMVDSAGDQWLRLRSRGTAFVPGSRRVSPDKMDNRLRRLAFIRDAAIGQFVTRPQVTRTIEMIVQPILPFRSAIMSAGAINVQGSTSCVDSFDSRSALASTSGQYDSAKRRSFGGVNTNGSSFNFAGEIRGNVGTNNASVQPSTRIIGTIDNNYYGPLPAISTPQGWIAIPIEVSKLPIVGGTLALPLRYKLSQISGNLHLTGSLPGVVDIWVDGNIRGSITVDASIKARFFVDGNINFTTDLKNKSKLADNLIIYGLPSPIGAPRTIDMPLSQNVQAAIYAPAHDMTVQGSSDFMGSLTVRSLAAAGSPRFHFDEALASSSGRILDYRIVSWVEEVF
jgi:cytoskeletal protein CcmA (bactofilin family)